MPNYTFMIFPRKTYKKEKCLPLPPPCALTQIQSVIMISTIYPTTYLPLHSPRIGAVVVESLEVFSGDEFAAVDSRLDGAEPSEDANLLNIAHNRRDLQPLQLGVDRVQPAYQVLQKKVECLGKTDEFAAVHGERRHFSTP